MTVTARGGVCPGCWAMKDPSRTPILGGTRRGRGGGFPEDEPDLLGLLSTAAATFGPPAVLALLVAYLLFFL